MYIDSHTHISKKYYDSIDIVIKNAYEANVKYLILSCCELDEIDEGISIANEYKNVFLAIGLHPSEVNKYNDGNLEYIKNIAITNNKVVAIGEIGLDYHYDDTNREKQRILFEKQLQLAEEINKPVVIHTRDATKDTIDILKKYKLKGVIHCFNGSKETLKEYLNMKYKVGIGGVVTFKNTNLPEILKTTSIENILLETDSPFLSPVPFRGEKNESKNIPIIAKKISEIYNISQKEVEEKTSKNTIELFDLKHLL